MKYYFNLTTGEVEFGKRSRGMNRMGPYDTIEEARQALATAQERNEVWADDDEKWQEAWDDAEDDAVQ